MKHLLSLFSAGFAGALLAADGLVTDVEVHQNWPWSPDVNIAYRYNGTTPTSVWFTATWKGQTDPVDIVQLKATGSYLVGNGLHRLTWDPVAAGYGNKALVDFRVQAVVTNADPRTYLVVDLVSGGHTLLANVPAGGWTDEHKKTKMVFRLVPAGIYELGNSAEELVRFDATAAQRKVMPRRRVRISNDYYLAIFPMSTAQMYSARCQYMYDTSMGFYIKSYDTFRGGAVAETQGARR